MKYLKLVALLVLVGLVLLFLMLSRKPVAPKTYQAQIETGGQLEKTYLSQGEHKVLKYEEPILQEFGKFIIYYPEELTTTTKTYPVIVLTNGSGTPLSKYPSVAEHFASWGFIVIGTEEHYSWNAFGAEMSLRYLEKMTTNQQVGDKESFLYQKVDFSNVGIVGHSQGGVGVFNALTTTDHKAAYKAAVALSPTNQELAKNLMWDYDLSGIDVPIMLISGAGGGDDWVVTGEQLQAIYNGISSPKLKLRRSNTGHGEMLYASNGYVLAWFMWHLQGDEVAKTAFVGGQAEIMTNPLYQDQAQHLLD